jgi:C-terminal four TMM region of protein-O-mannosyltransferase
MVAAADLGVDIDDPKDDAGNKKDMPFLAKFFELQGLMIHHNSALTQSHPYSSAPISWPFVVRGISFWVLDSNSGKEGRLETNLPDGTSVNMDNLNYWGIPVRCNVGSGPIHASSRYG